MLGNYIGEKVVVQLRAPWSAVCAPNGGELIPFLMKRVEGGIAMASPNDPDAQAIPMTMMIGQAVELKLGRAGLLIDDPSDRAGKRTIVVEIASDLIAFVSVRGEDKSGLIIGGRP